MNFIQNFWTWITQAVMFGRDILTRLFSNSLTVGFLPLFIAVIIFGALVAYIIRPFLAAGTSDIASDNWRKSTGRSRRNAKRSRSVTLVVLNRRK